MRFLKCCWNLRVPFIFRSRNCMKPFSTSSTNFTYIHDHNYYYFRNNDEYKASIVPLNPYFHSCITNADFFSFLFKKNMKKNTLLHYVSVRENIMKLNTSQIKDIMCIMANTGVRYKHFPLTIKWLDEKCYLSAPEWPIETMLYVLDAFYHIIGYSTFKLEYYFSLTNIWSRKSMELTKNNIVQIFYFIGLAKVVPLPVIKNLENVLKNITAQFSDVEWAIVCISFYRTKTKVNSASLLFKTCQVAKNMLSTDERFHLISLLKVLRHAGYYDENLQNLVKAYIEKYISSLNFVECTHFIAFFAAFFVYDQLIFESFEKHCIGLLIDEMKHMQYKSTKVELQAHPSIRIRAKDISRFFWALVSVGFIPKDSTVQVMMKVIRKRVNDCEYCEHPQLLVDILHSLALIAVYPKDLLNMVFSEEFLKKQWEMALHKPRYQLHYLYMSAQVESPECVSNNEAKSFVPFFRSIPKSINKEKNERKGFNELISMLKDFFHGDATRFECSYAIPHIVIAGVIVKNQSSRHSSIVECKFAKQSINSDFFNVAQLPTKFTTQHKISDLRNHICLEILDEAVCAKNSSNPLGLMKSKIRLLKKLSYNVVQLSPIEIIEVSKLPLTERIKHVTAWLNS